MYYVSKGMSKDDYNKNRKALELEQDYLLLSLSEALKDKDDKSINNIKRRLYDVSRELEVTAWEKK